MPKTKAKKSQALKKRWPPRLCHLFKCKRRFDPRAENQGFHKGECRIRAFWIRREGGADAERQRTWEIELKSAELEQLKTVVITLGLSDVASELSPAIDRAVESAKDDTQSRSKN